MSKKRQSLDELKNLERSKDLFDEGIFYPCSDGKPMADDTLQYQWMVTIKEGLETLLPNDFIAADVFWYPVKGNPKIVYAPDVMVALGRPKGYRSSYRQWQEGNIAPQIVFEVLSNSNSVKEIAKKLDFYSTYQVQEYYVYDPHNNKLSIWCRNESGLTLVNFVGGWTSPLLGIRFQLSEKELKIFHPTGEVFHTFQEVVGILNQERKEKELAIAKVEQERIEKEQAIAKVEQERIEKERLKEKLRQLGIDPDSI